ncbi:MAG: M20 family peptidase [bacterium]
MTDAQADTVKRGSSPRRFVRWIAFVVGVVFLGLVAVVVGRTLRFKSRQLRVDPVRHVTLDPKAVVARLSTAIRFRTVSHPDPAQVNGEPFEGLIRHLETSFPRVHRALRRERVGEHGLLFTWRGSDPSQRPVLWVAHLDVVPVEAKGSRQWTHPPFGGAVVDGFVWGRGTMDDKAQTLAMLEALEHLLGRGFQPRRTLLLAVGADEEVGGIRGAKRIAALLKRRGVRPIFALDEGLVITRGMVPGVRAPVALIGVAEKGYLTLELTVRGQGGHSSMPPKQTAVGILAAAVTRLEDNPMPARLTGAVRLTFEHVGPEMSFWKRLAFANLWLFGALVEKQLAAKPSTNALLRTTLAPTVIQGSVKENVLAQRARALVNARIHPQDSVAAVLAHARQVIRDPRVRVSTGPEPPSEPTPASRVDSVGYRALARTIRQVFPGTLVAPGLMIAMTDVRHYRSLCDDLYRFQPLRITDADRARFHGVDERVSVKSYLEMINFYVQLARNANQ